MLPEIKVGETYTDGLTNRKVLEFADGKVGYRWHRDKSWGYGHDSEKSFRSSHALDKPIPVERLLTLAELPPVPFGVKAPNGWQRAVTEIKDGNIFMGAACWTIMGCDDAGYEFHDGKQWRSFKTTDPLPSGG